MPDIDSASDDDGSSSDPPSESSDFAPTNWHGAANAGGPAAADAVSDPLPRGLIHLFFHLICASCLHLFSFQDGYSSCDEKDIDLIIDNIITLEWNF